MFRNIACGLVLTVFAAGPAGAQGPAPNQTVRYACDYGRSLTVEYYAGPTRTLPGGMPMPGGHVVVTLADGTRRTLQQTPSGSGIRYANQGETFVFWSKGDGAFVEEGPSQTQTYSGCVGQ